MKKYEDKVKLQEMAYIDTVKGMKIEVYTDHNPPHFHVTKIDNFEVRLSIKNIKVLSYKWQKSGKEISSKELDAIKIWYHSKKKNIPNEQKVKMFWDGLNPKN